MHAEHCTLAIPGGPDLFARCWRPDRTPQGAILCLHGVESHSEWFEEVAPPLAEKGLTVLAYDRPGWGRSEGERGHLASYHDAIRQIEYATNHLRETHERVHLMGLSWGGLLALYAALRRGLLFDSVTLIAPGICPKRDLPFWETFRAARDLLLRDGHTAIPLPIETMHFTYRPDRRAFIESDPYRIRSVTASFCLETLKMRRFVHETLGRRRLPPTLLLLAEEDAIIDNEATTRLLLREDIAINHYPGAAHSLVFEDPGLVADDIHELIRRVPPPPTGKRIVVMGAGAVGSMVGGLLALRGHDVVLVGRSSHIEVVNRRGLELRLGEGERRIGSPLRGVTSPSAISQPADFVILAVKSYDTDSALEALRPVVGEDTVFLSLQNGVGNEERIARVYPDHIVLAGAICAYLELAIPGKILWSDDRGGVATGTFCGNPDDAFKVWRSILPDTGMEAIFYHGPEAARSVKWSKLMLNAAFNALNAATGLSTAEILAHPEYGELAVRALKEGFAVLGASHIAVVDLPGYPVKKLRLLSYLPSSLMRRLLARMTSRETRTVSSMAQDRRKGRSVTEIDEINGAIVQWGKKVGIRTPANETLCAMMRSL